MRRHPICLFGIVTMKNNRWMFTYFNSYKLFGREHLQILFCKSFFSTKENTIHHISAHELKLLLLLSWFLKKATKKGKINENLKWQHQKTPWALERNRSIRGANIDGNWSNWLTPIRRSSVKFLLCQSPRYRYLNRWRWKLYTA